MLDDLLGRTELRERIAELEEEIHHLERELEAERDRRADAVSARQDAEERVNRLEDRIAGLEGRLEPDDAQTRLTYRRTDRLRGRRCEAVLDRLRTLDAGPEGALTAVVEDTIPEAVREVLAGEVDRTALVDRASPCIVVADDSGLVSGALSPPLLPDPFVVWDASFHLEEPWFRPTGRFTLALVRADLFAIGSYDGTDRVAFEGFESEVKGDHSKGGFSQGRFERRREAQIADHLERCRDAIADRDTDRCYVVGDGQMIAEFEAEATATAAVDATGTPERALEAAFDAFWTTTLYAI